MEDSAKLRLQWHDHGNELSRYVLARLYRNFSCRSSSKFYRNLDFIITHVFVSCRLSREIFGNDDLTDVTLTCRGGTPFYAHKIILAAASTYFKSFFKEVHGKMCVERTTFPHFSILS